MSHMQSHRTAKCLACHNCNSTQSFQQCMSNPKNTFTTSSMPTQQSSWKHHNMEVSYVQSVWWIITVSWKFRLKCCWSTTSQMFDACTADVWSGPAYKQYHMQYLLHWTPANTHRLTVWLRELAYQDAEAAPIVFLVKTCMYHFLYSNVVYSCSFLAVVNFSNLLLLQNRHMQPLS